MSAPRSISLTVRSFIEREEGEIPFAYDDSLYPPRAAKAADKIRGTLTAGVGHVGPDVYVTMAVPQALIDKWLDQDVTQAEWAVTRNVTVPLNDNQYGALVSFVFNVGAGAFQNSTLLKLVNAGKFPQVPAELMKWDHTRINGVLVESAGLKKRRNDEGVLWSTPATSVPPPATDPTTSSPSAVGEKKPVLVTLWQSILSFFHIA